MAEKITYLREKRGKAPKMPRLRLILLGVLVIILIKALSTLIGGGIGTKTAEVLSGSLSFKIAANTYAIRQETTYYAPRGGLLTALVQEGQRVAANGIVCELKGEQEEGLAQTLNKTRQEINRIETEYNQLINQKQNELLGLKDPSQGEALRSEIESLRGARDRELQGLTVKLQEIFDELSASISLVRVDGAGLVSFNIILGEPLDLLGLNDMGQLNPKTLEGVRWSSTEDKQVKRGEPIFRVVDNFSFYLFIPVEDLSALPLGKQVTVNWPHLGTSVEAVVCKVVESATTAGVMLETKRFLPEFVTMIWEPAEIVIEVYTGSIVPQKALVRAGEQVGVYVSTETGPVFRPVDLLYNDGRQAVISGVAPGNHVQLK